MSDLHLEFHRDAGREFISSLDNDCDVLVLAGDIDLAARDLQWSLTRFCNRFARVVYVVGNHELYRSSPSGVEAAKSLATRSLKNLSWLENEVVVIDGVRFAGTTLWYRNDPMNAMYERDFSDFRNIKEFKPWVYDRNRESLAFLEREVDDKTVVVTHYLPTPESIAERWRGSEINRFFMCDVTEIVFDKKPPIWIHGHTHDTRDFVTGQTRIVCNPFGYAGRDEELNPEFDPKKTVVV